MCYCVLLMCPQIDFGIHSIKSYMATVILTRTSAIEFFVINLAQFMSSVRVFPYPILKRLFNKFLLRYRNRCFFFVKYSLAVTIFIFNIIKDTNITKIKSFFNNFISVYSSCTIGLICFDITFI